MKIDSCRLCKKSSLSEILSLGNLSFTGIFPALAEANIQSGELNLILCTNCGLVQLDENFPLDLMYGENYGYRSGLNSSMVNHLRDIVKRLESLIELKDGDTVLDIASNDGTLLSMYSKNKLKLIGIDPTSNLFADYIPSNVRVINDFFDANTFLKTSKSNAKIVTSISMFYDLPDPVKFAEQVNQILDENGVWFLEQSYAPWMAESGAYDTICHEHLEYYSLNVLKDIFDRSGFRIIDAFTNDVNGGSVAILACKKSSEAFNEISPHAKWLLKLEVDRKVSSIEYWKTFGEKVKNRRNELNSLIEMIKSSNKTIMALGASTKGNVLLQYSGIDKNLIESIGEVNPHKFGKVTPGSLIPIVSEAEILRINPDYLLILPWHFKNTFMETTKQYRANGGKLIFPLPQVEIVS